ncbi:MAG: rane protein [Frankiales bacterium]|nr:rane protein [Frankiales bacterium]
MQPGRISALTGLRGLAVALVVAAHAHVSHLSAGLFGVDVFFVLSGFLITNVLLQLSPFGGRKWGYFLGRRAARLLPSLAATLVVLAGWVLVADVPSGGKCLALASTHTMDLPLGGAGSCPGPFHITWSLAAEEQFYLAWPLLVLLLSRLPRRRAAAGCVVAYGGFWALAGLVSLLNPATAGWWNFSPAGRPSALLLGAALAFLVPLRGPLPALDRVAARLAVPLFVTGLVVTGMLLALPHGPRQVLLGPLVAVPATLLIAALVLHPWGAAARLCRHRALVWLGEVSYCLYLVHDLLLHISRDQRADDSHLTNGIGVGAALAIAWVMHRFVEQPLRRRGYAWLGDREAARTPLPAPTLVG